ncbi:MAG: NUDIX domain-containing protein [bacterium]|nr:NUDIX domain-containing protein [bacterium]
MKPGIDYVGVATPFYCHDGNGKFLFHRRSKNCRDEHNTWDTGSGKLELGLTPEQNVLKEVMEEYGCHGNISECLPPYSLFREWNNQKTHWLMIPFFVKVDPSQVKLNEPQSMDEIGWFELDNIPNPLHTGFAYSFNKYKDIFLKYANRN